MIEDKLNRDERLGLECLAQAIAYHSSRMNASVEVVTETAKKFQDHVQGTDHVDMLVEALRLTVEYVGVDVLPPVTGWSWYDALVKLAPEVAERFRQEYHRRSREALTSSPVSGEANTVPADLLSPEGFIVGPREREALNKDLDPDKKF